MGARWHMDRFGSTQEQLAHICSKNHLHGSLNPLSQYQQTMSVAEVLADKSRGRELIAQGTPESLRAAAAMLDTLVTRNPEDAEAHILKQNAYALLLRPGPEESGIVRVPALVSLEGADAPEGRAVLYGLAQAQANINLRGGVDGRQVVIDLYDDRSQTNQALLEAQKITRDPRYLVCFGPFSSQRVLAAAPLFNDAGLPDLAPSASDPRVWEAGPFLFTASDSNDPRLQALADHFASQGFTRGALVVNEDNLLSGSMARAFEQAFTKKGGKIVARASYDDNTQDFSNQVAQLADQGAEFVLASEFRGLPVAQLANALKKSGLKIPLAAQVIPFSPDLIEQGGADVEGLLLSGYFLPDQDSPAVRKYVDEYHQIFGEREPSHVDAGSYDAAMLLFDALGAALQAPAEGQPLIRIRMQRLAARNYLASIGNDRPPYDGVSGRFALSSRSDLRKVYLLQVKDGRYQRVNAP
jgi:branched-chain amino acid transport system substrate-binding protein